MALLKQRGSVLVYTLLVLVAMMGIAMSLASVFIPKIRSINETGNSVVAIYAADSASEACLYEARNQPASAVPRPILTNQSTIAIASLSATPVDVTNDCRMLTPRYFRIRSVGTYNGVSRAFEITQ